MADGFSEKTMFKFKILGIYQISGGAIGLALLAWAMAKSEIITGLLILVLLAPCLLYSYSIFCGILLVKRKPSGLTYSMINQCMQLLGFAVAGYGFKYFSGVFFSVSIDLTNSASFTFNLGPSNYILNFNQDIDLIVVDFNFVALFLIFFIDKLKRKIDQERLEAQFS